MRLLLLVVRGPQVHRLHPRSVAGESAVHRRALGEISRTVRHRTEVA